MNKEKIQEARELIKKAWVIEEKQQSLEFARSQLNNLVKERQSEESSYLHRTSLSGAINSALGALEDSPAIDQIISLIRQLVDEQLQIVDKELEAL